VTALATKGDQVLAVRLADIDPDMRFLTDCH
jgi:hypothetical protein